MLLPYTIPSTGLCVAAIIAGAFAWPYLPEILPLVGYAVCALAGLYVATGIGAIAWLRWTRPTTLTPKES
jgi:hypothetical protein